ncbi:hypothetical protein M3Y94_01096500 [Aphelenchoides besseyi]|nr:hypothetical protein M3Y94_01096500 [Aphelenchoides besseyi]KAI6221658.1 hypothetical protein M3Y95_00985400 [Aphelenchoides besseyi]
MFLQRFCFYKSQLPAFRVFSSFHVLPVRRSLFRNQTRNMGQSFSNSTSITHVIFDFDGVMIDSELQYSKAMQKCLKPHGKTLTLEQKLNLMGRKKSDAIRGLLEMHNLDKVVSLAEMLNVYNSFLDNLLEDCPILPGVERLVNHLHRHKIPLAICTGSDAEEFELKTRKNLGRWLEIIPIRVLAGSDVDVKRGKPDPDPYLVTMKRFVNPPASAANCLVFEDSINGAHSALNAGMRCILIPQKQFSCEATERAIADLRPRLSAVLTSMKEFCPEEFGLPAFSSE